MTKLPLIAFAALVAVAGVAAPALAAMPMTASGNVPLCSTGTSSDLDAQKDALATQLQLSTKQGSSIDVWNGCLQVTTIDDGVTTVAYYDPDSLKLIAEG